MEGEYDEEYVPEPPKLRRGRAKAVSVDPEPEIQPIPARPRSRAKKADPVPEEPPPEPKPKRTRAKPPEPQGPEWTEVKPKRARKKPEPGSVPPRDISFNSARGPINFTAHKASAPLKDPPPSRPYRSPYEHLHGPPANRFSHLMSAW